eukprot:s1379_g11.t1
MYVALQQLFPDLRIVLLDVQDLAYLVIAAKELDVDVESLATASLDDFVEGVERCNVIQWSLDSPAFSFFKYRDLFYSTPYILGLFNLQGCNPPWRLNGIPVDRYYCEYLYQGFKATICGKVNENNFAEYMGQELYFPMVDAGCGENICLCHAHSDAYIDFHLELLCRYEGHKQFMGQWGQDEFLVENVFGKNDLRGQGIYVDVGSSHPYHLSNTAYLDTCLNWRGVCMEPNPRLKHIIRGVRTCSVIDACAWANKTTMKFANGLELAARTDAAELKPSTPGEIEEDTHPSETFFEARQRFFEGSKDGLCAFFSCRMSDVAMEGQLSSALQHQCQAFGADILDLLRQWGITTLRKLSWTSPERFGKLVDALPVGGPKEGPKYPVFFDKLCLQQCAELLTAWGCSPTDEIVQRLAVSGYDATIGFGQLVQKTLNLIRIRLVHAATDVLIHPQVHQE